MGRVFNSLMAAGLATGLVAGCGEQSHEQPAHITGFAHGIDGQIVEDQWIFYEEQDHVIGEVRNVEKGKKLDGCREVGDTFWDTEDDWKCAGDLWCSTAEEDETHCEPEYKTVYSFERLEEVVVEDCPAPIRKVEYKREEEFIDEACIAKARGRQRVNRTARYVVWVITTNPKYDAKEHNKESPQITTQTDITAKEWQKVSRETKATARVISNRIIDVEFAF